MLTARGVGFQISNEIDGLGNPKGDVYSSRELSVLLDHFSDLERFIGVSIFLARSRDSFPFRCSVFSREEPVGSCIRRGARPDFDALAAAAVSVTG